MKLLKVVAVVCTVVFSSSSLSMSDQNKEPELTPEPNYYLTQGAVDPLQQREESYQEILAELEQVKVWNPDDENPEVNIAVFPQSPMGKTEAYDFLMSVMRDMPEGSNSGFRYFNDGSMVTTKVNRVGVDYLYSLGTVDLSSTKAQEASN